MCYVAMAIFVCKPPDKIVLDNICANIFICAKLPWQFFVIKPPEKIVLDNFCINIFICAMAVFVCNPPEKIVLDNICIIYCIVYLLC